MLRHFLAWLGLGPEALSVAFDFTGLITERLMRLLIGFVIAAMVARHLGTAGYGELSYGLALGAIVAGVAQLGLDGIVVREITRQPDQAPAILTTAACLKMGGLLVVLPLMLSLGWPLLFSGHADARALFVLCLTSISTATAVPPLWFQAHALGRQPAWVNFFVFALASVARLVLIATGGTLLSFAWVAVAEIAAGGAATLTLTTHSIGKGGKWRWSTEWVHVLFRDAWPLWISGLAVTAYMRADQIILRYLSGPDEAGIFAAALRLTEQGYMVPMVLATAMLGLLSKSREQRGNHPDRSTFSYFAASALLGYAFMAAIWLSAPWIFAVAFGKEFQVAAPVAMVQSLGTVFVFSGVARSQVLMAWGYSQFSMVATLAGATLSMLLNFALVPAFGALGAAWAGVIAQCLSCWISTWWHPDLRELALMQTDALRMPWRCLARVTSEE